MINENGHRDIINALRGALARRAADDVPAFKRGRMFFDFDAGKVRVADAPDVR